MKKNIVAILALSLLIAACGTPKIETDQDKILEIQNYTQVMKNGDLTDPVHGKETGFWYGALLGTEGTNANGVGYIHAFEDGASIITANLNILPREDKKVFVVWLTDADGKNPVKAGELRSILGDARHSVKFETNEKISSTPKVIVTLETSVNVTLPSKAIAEGSLKEPAETK